jgi:S-layer protein
MTITSAAAFDDNTNLAAAATGFERLTISDAAGAVTLNMSNLGYDYVTTSGTSGGAFVLDNFANEGTVVLTAAQTGTTEVAIDSADTNAADVLNVMTKVSTADIVAGELIAADVETINITATDSNVDEDKDGTSYETGDRDLSTLKLTADTAETVKVTGNANLDLDLNTSTKVTKVDASTLEGDLTLIADGAVAGTEVIGGTGDDVLTASGENDVLKGGAGKDIFNAGDLTQIYGGDGADTFNFDVISSYTKVSTVHDAETGDVFNLVDNGTVGNGTAVDKFYAAGAQYNENTTTDVIGKINASLVQTGEGEATWFNHGDNTYIVIDADDANDLAAGAQDTYQQGEDTVIEIVGVFDLSAEAFFNATAGTLEMA